MKVNLVNMSKTVTVTVRIVDIEGTMFYEKDYDEVDVWAKEGVPIELTFKNQGRQFPKLKAAAQKSADQPACKVRIIIEQKVVSDNEREERCS